MHEALSSAAYAKGLSLQEGHYGSQQQIARRLGPDNVRSSSSSGQQQQVHQLRMQSYGVPSMQVVSSFNANGSVAIRKLLRTRAPLSSDSSSGSEDAESTAIYALIPQHTRSGHDPASRESGCPGHTTLAASTIGCVLPTQSSQGQTYLRQLHEHPGRVVQYAGGCLEGSLQQQPSPGQGGLGSVPQHSAMAEGEAGSMTAASGEEHSQISTRRRGNGHGCGKGNGAVAGMAAHFSVCFAEGGEDPELLAPAALCTPDMRYLQQLGDVSGAGSHGAGSHGAAASPTASLAGGGEAESLVPLQPYLSMGGGLTVLTPLPEGQAWPETFVYM